MLIAENTTKNHRQNRKGQPHAKDALRGLSERILLPCYKAKCIQNEAGHSCHHTANRLFSQRKRKWRSRLRAAGL